MTPADFKPRLERIRLTVVEWARRAGVDKHTGHRFLAERNDTRGSKERALETALVQEELALRDYLNALHPPVSAGAIAIAEAQAGVLPDPLAGRRLEAAE